MEITFQQKSKNPNYLSPAEAEELFVERMAELLIDQIKNENGDQNEDQIEYASATL